MTQPRGRETVVQTSRRLRDESDAARRKLDTVVQELRDMRAEKERMRADEARALRDLLGAHSPTKRPKA